MEAEKAEDVEEVEGVEGAKGRTSSRMGITDAAKFALRSLRFLGGLQVEPLAERNGTFNLKNMWQAKKLQAHFLEVWQGKRLVDFACWARTLRDAGRLTASVAITTKTLYNISNQEVKENRRNWRVGSYGSEFNFRLSVEAGFIIGTDERSKGGVTK